MNPVPPETVPVVAEVLTKAAQTTTSSPSADPWISGLAWISGILLAILALAKPFMALTRQYKSDRADNARDDADQATFERQTQQIEKLTSDVEKLKEERDRWFREATELKARVERLEGYESSMARMRTKLDEKDQVISELRKSIGERDDRIMALMQELMKTNERLHDLEVRLSKDEHERCFNCSMRAQNA